MEGVIYTKHYRDIKSLLQSNDFIQLFNLLATVMPSLTSGYHLQVIRILHTSYYLRYGVILKNKDSVIICKLIARDIDDRINDIAKYHQHIDCMFINNKRVLSYLLTDKSSDYSNDIVSVIVVNWPEPTLQINELNTVDADNFFIRSCELLDYALKNAIGIDLKPSNFVKYNNSICYIDYYLPLVDSALTEQILIKNFHVNSKSNYKTTKKRALLLRIGMFERIGVLYRILYFLSTYFLVPAKVTMNYNVGNSTVNTLVYHELSKINNFKIKNYFETKFKMLFDESKTVGDIHFNVELYD